MKNVKNMQLGSFFMRSIHSYVKTKIVNNFFFATLLLFVILSGILKTK